VFTVDLGDGHVGYGEEMRFRTWERTTPGDVERALDENAVETLWDGSLGAGLQMALFDAVGKAVDSPAGLLIGRRTRERVPISWWAMDLPAEAWVNEAEAAHQLGYDTIKLKGRPWFDIRDGVARLGRELPDRFAIDIDFNETLLNAEQAVPLLRALEGTTQLNCFESPIPEHDHEGYREIRAAVETDIAMHYGESSKNPGPPPTNELCEGLCDVFVGGGGPNDLLEQNQVLGAWNVPFWIQLRGTGIAAAYTLQIGSVLDQATWPAITRHQVYEHNLLKTSIVVEDGAVELPDQPGLGYSIDPEAIRRYRVDPPDAPPEERTLIEVSRGDGTREYFAGTTQIMTASLRGEFPFYERDIDARVLSRDEHDDWDERYREAKADQ
jgi:galactonate dehydratase